MMNIYNFPNFGNKYDRSEMDMAGQNRSGQVRDGYDR
jgi:hypothetical protein